MLNSIMIRHDSSHLRGILKVVAVMAVIHSSTPFISYSSLMSRGTSFIKHLCLVSVQLIGRSDNVLPPVVSRDGDVIRSSVSMAAGLPHFSTGHMRCWGRDTFISMKGLFLLTGRFETAR